MQNREQSEWNDDAGLEAPAEHRLEHNVEQRRRGHARMHGPNAKAAAHIAAITSAEKVLSAIPMSAMNRVRESTVASSSSTPAPTTRQSRRATSPAPIATIKQRSGTT